MVFFSRFPGVRAATALVATIAISLACQWADAARFNFRNECPFVVERWDNSAFVYISPNGGVFREDVVRSGIMWRHGYNPEATLAEFTVDKGAVWYDISIIPPGTGDCTSYEDCRAVANGRKGFNIPLAIVPLSNVNGANCRALFCLDDACSDAFLYPHDNLKVFSCPDSTEFDVVFCPGYGDNGAGDGNNDDEEPPPPTPAPTAPPTAPPTPAPTPSKTRAPYFGSISFPGAVKASFEYRGAQAGNVPGSYSRVTSLVGCQRQQVNMQSPVGPLSQDVTMVFRGPMEIYNIAVFDGSVPGVWQRVSWYRRGGAAKNMAFFNNKNIDYSGQDRWGPQAFASADGRYGATQSTPFAGSLAEASNPSAYGGGPGVDTGVEVNIMTQTKCGDGEDDCKGYHDGQYSYKGWGGGRKIFVTRVKMPMSGSKPNLPAIWMLNTQIMYTGQYNACNCRGMGSAGGCGELDIAEVIDNQNPALDRVSTHHYFYDGSVPNPAGGDNFASRPSSKSTFYVTIIDEMVGNGLIKILEVDAFNFNLDRITTGQVQKWINA